MAGPAPTCQPVPSISGIRGVTIVKAVWIIRDEHRRHGAVLGLIRQLLNAPDANQHSVDFDLIGLALDYVADFVAIFHHAKEDQFLFRLLCQRTSAADAIVNELEEQHVRGERKRTELRILLGALQRQPTPERFARFKADALAYVEFETAHALLESRNLLPIAEQMLTDADWVKIDAAFQSNEDPLFGAVPRQKFDRLLKEITSRTTAPQGYETPVDRAITGARWPLN